MLKLKSLRKKAVVKFTMWLLVVVFVMWGVGSIAVGTKNYAGVIFGRKISVPEYNRSYAAVLTRARMAYGDNLPKIEKFLNLKNQAWDRLILKYEAKKRFIGASNRDVIEKIATLAFFQRNGVFDRGIYKYVVENVFQTPLREFEESIRDDIIIGKLAGLITKDIAVAEEEIKKAYRDENELADITYLLISPSLYKDKVTIKDEELTPYYNEHKDNLRSPVTVNVTYLKIPFGQDKEKARYTADEILASIKQATTLEKASREYNIPLKETGFFSLSSAIPEIGLSYPFALTAMGLKKDQLSDVVETTDAFYIMRLKDRKPPAPLSFEEAKEQIKEAFILEKSSVLAEKEAGDIIKRLKAENKSLEDISKELNLPLPTAKELSRKTYVREVGLSEPFAETAFSLKVGEVGGPAKTQRGYAIIRLDNLTSADEDKFQKEKGSFAKTLQEEKEQDYFQGWFLKLKDKANLKDNLQ